MAKGHLLSATQFAEFLRALRWIKNFRATGPGVTFANGAEGATLTIGRPKDAPAPKQGKGGGNLYRVTLTQTGGANGSNADRTAPTWTYTVTLDGVVVGTGLAPTWGYYLACAHTVATEGVGYYDNAGAFVLMDTNAKPGVGGCT